ncbi:MAG: SCP2 sterol-binding domain-containing protein [Pseudopelagicola sp.]|nr:SCP2 sterol-binding domain-containing protein [Pseudopelagicola sp.]
MTEDLPEIPQTVQVAMRPLPLRPVSILLSRLARRVAARHPDLFERMGEYGGARFALDMTDQPFVLLLDLGHGDPSIKAMRRARVGAVDATIRGPVSGFLGMMHGTLDGDALFFSRDLAVEGDTSSVLALRNAIDDAELDLAEEIGIGSTSVKLLRQAFGVVERATGLPLNRHQMTMEPYS